MVRTYTKDQKGVQLSEHFTVGDFWACDKQRAIKLDTALVGVWEKLYAHFGTKPLLRNAYGPESKNYKPHATAGYRDKSNWSGSKTSRHCYGKATDVYIPGVPAYKLAQFAETLPEVGGIGLYLSKSGDLDRIKHIHIDTRVKRTLWGWNGWTSKTSTPGFGGIPCVFKYDKRKLQRSAAIEEIQRKLNASNCNCGTPDGVFGERTKTALMIYQRLHGLKADGIFGKGTNKAMGLFDW